MRDGSLAVGSNREPQIPEMGRVGNTSPRWVPFTGLTPVVLQRPRSGSIDGEAPTEPPIGDDRGIVPSPRSPTGSGSAFQGAGRERINLINTSARRPAVRGARGHSVLNCHKVRMTEAFPITAWVKDITGHRYRWD